MAAARIFMEFFCEKLENQGVHCSINEFLLYSKCFIMGHSWGPKHLSSALACQIDFYIAQNSLCLGFNVFFR